MSLSPFGRDSQRGQRRRRLLAEECATLAHGGVPRAEQSACALPPQKTAITATPSSFAGSRRYWILVPRRPLAFVFLFLAGAGLIAAVECLYAWMPDLTAALRRPGRIAAFELGEPGSLATWIASLELLAAAGIALLVYRVRRHRSDDYHGRYRVWLWATLCWFLLAADLLHRPPRRLPRRDDPGDRRPAGRRRLDLVGDRLCLVVRLDWDETLDGHVAVPPIHGGVGAGGVRLRRGRAAHFGWRPFGAGVRGVLIQQGTLMSSHLLALSGDGDSGPLCPPQRGGLVAAAPRRGKGRAGGFPFRGQGERFVDCRGFGP